MEDSADFTRDQVHAVAQQCQNYRDLAMGLGLGPKSRRLAKSIVRSLRVDVGHFIRKPYTFKSEETRQTRIQKCRESRDQPWVEILVLKQKGKVTPGDVLRRALQQSGMPYLCKICGQGPSWNGSPLVIQVDHINGFRWDDRRDNLRFLCPNCHTQTPTFCGRNRRTRSEAREYGTPKKVVSVKDRRVIPDNITPEVMRWILGE
jgi:hypothetical protein